MASAPWYLNNEGPTLKHQKKWKSETAEEKTWYDRGAKVFQATKWRKGACENCGSLAHKTKDCMERPRSKGAKWTNKNIAADEKVENIQVASFDAKRDRWNGYTADEWTKQAEKFEKISQLRHDMCKREALDETFKEEDLEADGEEEEDKVEDTEEAHFAKIEKRVRTVGGGATGTVRNLRIREDTAKYLLNLDTNSAYYDPKSRSMREDPNPDKDASQKTFAGDNFVRSSGQIADFSQLNQFSITAYEKGHDVHIQATPSQAELAHRQFLQKKAALATRSKDTVLSKYGNAAETPDEQMLALKASEAYVEYDASGRVIRGHEVKIKSARYEEDVCINNHTSVWGSWWKDGQWGFACCHQMVKNSYCIGKVIEDEHEQMQKNMERLEASKKMKEKEEDDDEEGSMKLTNAGLVAGGKLWGASELKDATTEELDPVRLREAILKQKKKNSSAAQDSAVGYNSLAGGDLNVSAEDMEAYRLVRQRADDPLAAIHEQKERNERGYV